MLVPEFLPHADVVALTTAAENGAWPLKEADSEYAFGETTIEHSDSDAALEISPQSRVAQRLSRLPGRSPPAFHGEVCRACEVVQLTVSRNRSHVNAHHDRNLEGLARRLPELAAAAAAVRLSRSKVHERFVTALIYLGHARVRRGGHTLFPLFDAPPTPSASTAGPEQSLMAASSAAAAEAEGRRALAAMRAALARRSPTDRHSTERRVLRDPEVGGAIRSLCDATWRAEEAGVPPPCLAMPPTPGTAVLYWHWTYGQASASAGATAEGPAMGGGVGDSWVPEWSNFHVACPSLDDARPKFALQSFRVNPAVTPPREAERGREDGAEEGGLARKQEL